MFRRKRAGVTVSVGEQEAELLRDLVRQYLEVLDSEAGEDAVTKRLYPDASVDDNQVRDAYRDLAHDSLADHKRGTAETALRTLGDKGPWHGSLSEEERDAWMVLLTDLRLVLGTRLDVDEEKMSMEPDPTDPEQWPLALMHYLGWLQESLVKASED
jgi:hypothetical protein